MNGSFGAPLGVDAGMGSILGNMNRTNLTDKQLRISNLGRQLEKAQERWAAGGINSGKEANDQVEIKESQRHG